MIRQVSKNWWNIPTKGLALSLESEAEGVWLNTGATALHKFVISFSVGVELIANKVVSDKPLVQSFFNLLIFQPTLHIHHSPLDL